MEKRKGKKKEFDELLKKYMERKELVKFYRTGTEGDANISGFILQMNDEFLLIQQEEEFFLNGYCIIRKDGFDSIRLSETEKYQRNVLDKEGILKSDFGLEKELLMESWQTIFEDLKRKDYFVIVECENLKEPTFTIGEIAKISKKSVGIRYFTPQGVIDKKPTKVKYKAITLVKFDVRYTNMYRKYLKEEGE